MKVSLIVIQGPDEGRFFTLPEGITDIGRDTICSVRLADSQISRRHIELSLEESALHIEDLNSRNGTLVNGKPISRGALHDGDAVQIGQTLLHVRIPGTGSDKSSAESVPPSISLDERQLTRQWSASQDVNALNRAKSDLEMLYRIGQILNKSLELSDILTNLLNVVFQEVRRIERCSIHLINDETGQLETVASRMLHTGEAYQPESFSRAIADQAIQEKRAILVFDARTDNRFSASDSVDEQNIRSAICVPLTLKDDIAGIIFADSANTGHPLTEEDLRLLTAIGLQAGTAIENARLYARLNEEKQALQLANLQLQQTQKELVQSTKMAAVGQVASGVVHDVKTPMMVIMGYANLVREKLKQLEGLQEKDPGLFEYLDNIEKGVNHSNDVVNNLLKFARPTKPDTEPVSANEIVEETLTFLRSELNKHSIQLKTQLQEDPPALQVDANQIKQVLINIIMNAVQAMEKNGVLELFTGPATRNDSPMSEIRIADDGCGMTDDQLKQIFDPFFTTKTPGEMGSGGTGLGLSVSYSIIEQHGGAMEAESEVGQGTRFHVYLPLSSSSVPGPVNESGQLGKAVSQELDPPVTG